MSSNAPEAPPPSPQGEGAPQVAASQPPTPVKGLNFLKKINLHRTGDAFAAEYSVMLIAITFVLSNVVWLIFLLAALATTQLLGEGIGSYIEMHLLVLWIAILSAVSAPVAGVLWSRVQGELATNPDYNGELPKGGARGFRTFWLVVTGLSMILMVAAALYGPITTSNFGLAFLGMSLPSLLSVAVLGVGVYMVTLPAERRKFGRLLLWVLTILTVVLAVAGYAWSANIPADNKSPYDNLPTSPIVPAPENYYDDMDADYNQDYYDSYPY